MLTTRARDATWETLRKLKSAHPNLKIVKLLKNSGQHNAILCGLGFVTGDIAITMDDDLQHPPEEIPKLLEKLAEGYDLVIGSYDDEKTLSLIATLPEAWLIRRFVFYIACRSHSSSPASGPCVDRLPMWRGSRRARSPT